MNFIKILKILKKKNYNKEKLNFRLKYFIKSVKKY